MHELSIAQSVVATVLERTGGRPVLRVRLQVGQLSGVLADSLDFCFGLVAAGTTLEGAALEIDQPTGTGHCRACGEDFELADLLPLCPCGSADVRIVAGRELVVTSVEVG
jgi:hydrogenase nickel incorporation protein HypA/HybF